MIHVLKNYSQRSIFFLQQLSNWAASGVLCCLCLRPKPKSLSFFYDGSGGETELNHIRSSSLIWVTGCVTFYDISAKVTVASQLNMRPHFATAYAPLWPHFLSRCHPRREHYIHGEGGSGRKRTESSRPFSISGLGNFVLDLVNYVFCIHSVHLHSLPH